MKIEYILLAIGIVFAIAAQTVSINYGLKQSIMLWAVSIIIIVPVVFILIEGISATMRTEHNPPQKKEKEEK